MRRPRFLFAFFFSVFSKNANGFALHSHSTILNEPTRLWMNHDPRGDIAESLTRLVAGNDGDRTNTEDESKILELIQQLEDVKDFDPNDEEDPDRFDPLLGLYEVSYTKTSQPNENPVGGKWTRTSGLAQKLFRTRRRSFQHILPTNTTGLGEIILNEKSKGDIRKVVAEAINVVSLEALLGLLRVTVILRGDATPLSTKERNDSDVVVQPLTSRAVRAWFDAPRIIFGRKGRILNLQFGPKSSVLLDALFVNDRVRIGMGGRSGTRFVFVRCQEGDDPEANEFRQLLQVKPMKRYKPLLVLGTASLASFYSLFISPGGSSASRVVRSFVGAVTGLLAVAISFSTGGIERDRNRYDIFPNSTVVPQPEEIKSN